MCICDLLVRVIVYNCNQFNGEFSCWFCLQKGEIFKYELGGILYIYLYQELFKDFLCILEIVN